MDQHTLNPAETALIKAACSLTARLDVQQTCAAMLQAVADMFAASSSWIMLHDAATNELVTTAFRGKEAECFAGCRFSMHAGLAGVCLASQQTVFVPDVRRETRWIHSERVSRSGLRSVLMVPLLRDSRPIGVVGLDSPRFTANTSPKPADIVRLEALAAHAVVGILNARQFDVVEQDRDRLRKLLEERRSFRSPEAAPKDAVPGANPFDAILGESSAVRALVDQVRLVAPADSTVLIAGETGTGKELVARVIRAASRRCAKPFVALNCAALPESLVESELFGYEKGAFTGALGRKAGRFELADRGTLFLDEIGDLPMLAQAKLLRVLQEREFQRVGGTWPVRVDVRMIAATNQELEVCMSEGRFRPDLYYRLSVFPIRLPPLRERGEDIPLLATRFVQGFAERLHKPVEHLSSDAMERLVSYDWPGNVRELQNVLERAVILAQGQTVTADLVTLPAKSAPPLHNPGRVASLPSDAGLVPFTETERRAILRALETSGWRISGRHGAAELLGLKPTTLHAKMKKLGVRRPAGVVDTAVHGGPLDAVGPRTVQ